jgi:FemAB-related protein (PEP-CTERM system-associated)
MIVSMTETLTIQVLAGQALQGAMPELAAFAMARTPAPLSQHPAWLTVLRNGLGHVPYVVVAKSGGRIHGILPLCRVSSLLFGKYLVSLPYLNSNGVIAAHPDVQTQLVDHAVDLAQRLQVKHLELRHETPTVHHKLTESLTNKVHMRLPLPKTTEELWKAHDPKVRNQIRKGEKGNFRVEWGGLSSLEDFYNVLSTNMRDLGTPVYGRSLFRNILKVFPNDAEICVVRTPEGRPVATALLLHGPGVTEVPTASSLREFNSSSVNMLMYSHLLNRAVERGQVLFDFGRSTTDGPTFKFKKQWGAIPYQATWQYAVWSGSPTDARPDNPRYQKAIRLWQKLPVGLTQVVGPPIVRGIP